MKKDLKKLAALAVALTLVLSTILPAFALASLPERYLNGEGEYYERFRRIFFGTDDEVSTYDEAAFLERVHMLWDRNVQELSKRNSPVSSWKDVGINLYLTDEASQREKDYTPEDFPGVDIEEINNMPRKLAHRIDFKLNTENMTIDYLYELFYIFAEREDITHIRIGCWDTPDEPIEPDTGDFPTEPIEPEPTEPTPTEPAPVNPSEPAPVITEPGENDITLGDLDGDGVVNAKDRIILTRHLAKWSGYETIDEQAADLDKDGKAEAKDRIILTRHLAKWQGYETL